MILKSFTAKFNQMNKKKPKKYVILEIYKLKAYYL